MVEMEHPKLGTETLEKLRQDGPIREIGYPIKSANMVDSISCIKSAKLAEEGLPNRSAIQADKKTFSKISNVAAGSNENGTVLRTKETGELGGNSSNIMRDSI